MRGGHNKKTAQEHIADGTFRADRHSNLALADEEVLKEMKNDLYADYTALKKEIKKLDLSNNESLEKFNKLNEARFNFVKTYHNISKTPLDGKKDNGDKDGFK